MTAIRKLRIIDETGAEAVIRAAEQNADRQGNRVVIAVVDPSGELIALRRTVGAQVASSRVAVDKARTAAIFVRPSREIERQVSDGRLGALALHGASALTGGIPLTVDGEVVGAIGTSGETPDEDESISIAGAAAGFSTVEVGALTYDGAKRVAEAADAMAAPRGVAPVVAVVDAGGDLIYLLRPAVGPTPGARGPAAGRHADPARRRGRRRSRGQRRIIGRRGPGAGGDSGWRAERLSQRPLTSDRDGGGIGHGGAAAHRDTR